MRREDDQDSASSGSRPETCDLAGVGAPEVFGNAAHSESLEQELRIRLLRNGASHSALHGAQQTDMAGHACRFNQKKA